MDRLLTGYFSGYACTGGFYLCDTRVPMEE